MTQRNSVQEDELTQQAASIYAIHSIRAQFQKPESNNFVFSLLSNSIDKTSFDQNWVNQIGALNRADEGLLRYCCTYLEENPDFAAAFFASRWHQCIQDRVNLQAGRWAQALITRLENKGEIKTPFYRHLQTNSPETLSLFTAVPEPMFELVRVNLYIEPDQTIDFLNQITTLNSVQLNSFCERLEVAKANLSSKVYDYNFPTIILYLNTHILHNHQKLKPWLTAISHLCVDIANNQEARSESAYLWRPNVTITQGFVLYKRYLKKLGLIEEIYSASYNYAFTHDSTVPKLLSEIG